MTHAPQHVSQSQQSTSVPPLPTIYNSYPPGTPNQMHQGYPPQQQQQPHYYVNNPQTPNTPSQYGGYSLTSPQAHYPAYNGQQAKEQA